MKRWLKMTAFVLAIPCVALAQNSASASPRAASVAAAPASSTQAAAPAAPMANPLSQALRDTETSSAKNMVAAAEAMPADKYDFKPTPGHISFGHLILHVAQSNNFLCSKISGQAAPKEEQLTETSGKDKLVAAIKASFDYCGQALASTDDSGLGNMIQLFGNRSYSKARTMLILGYDWGDHYSAQATYLRLNGILPPTAPPPKQ